MKNPLMLVFFLISTSTIFAQTQVSLTGKWKITYFNAGLQHDYKTNKTILTKEMEDLKKSDKESDKFALAFSTNLVEMFKDFTYAFDTNGQYEEFIQGKAPRKGSYSIDAEKKMLFLTAKNKQDVEYTDQMNFELKGSTLQLTIPKGDETIGFTFEKVN
jgi:hypothetical protein